MISMRGGGGEKWKNVNVFRVFKYIGDGGEKGGRDMKNGGLREGGRRQGMETERGQSLT